MSSNIERVIGGEVSDDADWVYNTYDNVGNSIVPLYIKGTPEIAVKNKVEVTDVSIPPSGEPVPIPSLWFFHNISSLPLHISVDFSTGVTVE